MAAHRRGSDRGDAVINDRARRLPWLPVIAVLAA